MESESSQNPPSSSATSATPQVRSRITVVCAECKRLKLKCDRRNPCGSCVKRDTTARCIYSPAAAEKVDLHSLNNRLIQVETLLAQLTSGQFTSSFPASNSWPPPPPSHGAIQASTSTSSSSSTVQPPPAPMPYTSLAIPLDDVAHIWLDHLDITTRISLEQSTSIIGGSSTNGVKVEASTAFSPDMTSHDISSSNLPEISLPSRSTKPLPPTTIYYLSRTQNAANLPFPDQPPSFAESQTSALKPTVTRALLDLLPPYMTSTPEPHAFQSLLSLAEQSTYHSYPSINWKQFRARASRMMATSFRTTPFPQPLSPEHSKGRDRDKDKTKHRNRRDTEARDPYPMPRTANPLPPFTPSVALPAQDGSDPCVKVEGVPFFGAVCAALALGVLESSRDTASSSGDAMLVDSYPPSGSLARGASSGTYLDAEYWYRLSVQALGEYERGLTLSVKTKAKTVEEYGLDYLIGCIFQVIFLVKGGLGPVSLESTDTYVGNSADGGSGNKRKRDKDRDRPNDKARHFNGVAAVVFPLVGKMVNIARKMGLGKDPHEIPLLPIDASGSAKKSKNRSEVSPSQTRAISNLYDAEMRRRVWWDVLYYDVFVSDALGHEPLINDDFNTKMPVGDVDEKVFSSVSTRIPIPHDLESGSSYSRDSFQYFRVKCRLALLVRTIQRRMCASELSTTLFNYGNATSCTSKNGYGYSIDQAASMEAEVTRWLDDLPTCYRLEKSTTELTVDPILASQRCEVAITAQRLILKVYMPFLRKHATVSETVPAPHQATCGSVNAAHLIIRACSILNTVWKGLGRENMPSASALSPAMFDFYPVTRILFDAAVVCAHASIKQTMPMMATPAEEALDLALDVFQDLRHLKKLGGVYGMGSGHAVIVGDAIKLLSELKVHAVAARGAMGPSLKRKHTEVEDQDDGDELEEEDHHLEYATPDEREMRSPPPVFNDLLPPPSRSDHSITTPTSQSPLSAFRIDQPLPRYANQIHGKDDKSKKKKPQAYPAVGIRVRTGKEGSSMSRRRLSPPSPTSNDHPHTNVASADSPMNDSPQQYNSPAAPPIQSHHQAAPSPLHVSVIDSERYRSRSSSLSQAQDSNPFPRRDSEPSYPPFSSSNSPCPDLPRRYTVGNYQPTISQASSVQPQPQGAYGASSQSAVIYDRAGSYDSQRGGYAASTEAYVPAQSPYLPSNSPYGATSGPLSTASSPYTTSSTNTTPTYPSPQIPTIPIAPAGQPYYSYESSGPTASQAYQNPFSSGGNGSYSQEAMSDVKPTVDVERYPTQAPIYQPQQSQTQWQSQPPPQQQYWQDSSTGNYYTSQ